MAQTRTISMSLETTTPALQSLITCLRKSRSLSQLRDEIVELNPECFFVSLQARDHLCPPRALPNATQSASPWSTAPHPHCRCLGPRPSSPFASPSFVPPGGSCVSTRFRSRPLTSYEPSIVLLRDIRSLSGASFVMTPNEFVLLAGNGG